MEIEHVVNKPIFNAKMNSEVTIILLTIGF